MRPNSRLETDAERRTAQAHRVRRWLAYSAVVPGFLISVNVCEERNELLPVAPWLSQGGK